MTPPVASVNILPTMYALILAGGKGERLRPLTDKLPKPMIALAGQPLLWHQVRWLRRCGVTDVVFLVGYLAEAVADYFGDGSAYGICAHYSREETPLGRGGALRKGLVMTPDGADEPVIAINGDIITEVDLGRLLADYRARAAANPDHLATILTVGMTSAYGIVDTGLCRFGQGFSRKGAVTLCYQRRRVCFQSGNQGVAARTGATMKTPRSRRWRNRGECLRCIPTNSGAAWTRCRTWRMPSGI